MNAISSLVQANPDMPERDLQAIDLREMACDVGEAVLLLSGGARDPRRVAELCENLRRAQTYLISEAQAQAGREAIKQDAVLVAAVARLVRPVSLAMAADRVKARTDIIAGRFKRFYDRAEQPDVRAALAAYHVAYPLPDDVLSYEDARMLVRELSEC